MPRKSPDRRQQFAAVAMFVMPAMAMTTSFGMTMIQLLILFAAGWWARNGLADWYRQHGSQFAWVSAAFGGYFLLSLLRALLSHKGMNAVDGPLRMLLALSCIGFVGWLRPQIHYFWLGLCIGTIGASLLALMQRLLLEMDRVEGYAHHPITFGNLALAMGVLSLCALPGWRKGGLVVLPFLSLSAGILASILSGSRGGWVALPLLAPLLWLAVGARRAGYAAVAALGLLALIYVLPESGVGPRVQGAVLAVSDYLTKQDASTTVGVRLELYKAAWIMFREHPWLGVGRDQFQPELLQLAAQGQLQASPALQYSSAHNDALHFLATGGILDFSFLILLYGAPFAFFLRAWRSADPVVRPPAMAGLIIVISFIAFGLTDVMFWLMMTKVFYVMMVCVFIGFCLQTPHFLCVGSGGEKPSK